MEWRLTSKLIRCSILLRRLHLLKPLLTRSSARLSYKVIAENDTDLEVPPLFIFHGLLGNKKHWESLGKTLLSLTKRSVVVADLRNHGDSPHVASHTYLDMAGDVLRLLKKLHIERACLIGHSMGGRTAMCVSLMAPEKVIGLLVVDISPVSSPPFLTEELPKVLAAMKTVQFKWPKNIEKTKKEVKKQLKKAVTNELLMRGALSNINVNSQGIIGWKCNLDALISNFDHIKSFPSSMIGKTYPGPTLFIGGQLSDFIPPDDLTKIREMFPQAVIHYVPNAGHIVHVDEPKAFLEHVITFVKNLQ